MSSGFFSIFIFPYEFWAFLFLSFRVGFVDFSLLNLLFPCGFVGFFYFYLLVSFGVFFFSSIFSLLMSFGLFFIPLFPCGFGGLFFYPSLFGGLFPGGVSLNTAVQNVFSGQCVLQQRAICIQC